MTDHSERPASLQSFDHYLRMGARLNLIAVERFRRFLRLIEVGCARREDFELLDGLIASRQSAMLQAGLVVPPPSAAQVVTGNFLVGHTIDPEGPNPVLISDTPPRPCVVIGSSGSGKSSLVGLLVAEVRHHKAVLIIDPRNDYTHMARQFPGEVLVVDAAKLPMNPLAPQRGVDLETNSRAVVSAWSDTLCLFHRSQNVLLDGIAQVAAEGRTPTVLRLVRFLRANARRYAHNREALNSCIDRLQSMIDVFGDAWNVERGVCPEDLLRNRVVVIRTESLGRMDLRVTFVVTLLQRLFLFLRALGVRENAALVWVVIEEGEYVLSLKLEAGTYSITAITELVHQSRAVGLQLCFVVQNPTEINRNVLNDAGNVFVFALREGRAQMSMVESLGLPTPAAAQIGSLGDRCCYCRLGAGDFREAFLMHTLDWPVDTTPLNPEEIVRYQAPFLDSLRFPLADVPLIAEEVPPRTPPSMEVKTPAPVVPTVSHRLLGFLFSVLAVGREGVTSVYKHARLAPGTGKKLFDQSVAEGLVGSHRLVLPGRGGQRTTAFLTEKGRDVIGAPPPQGKGGVEHVGYQHEFAYALEECGFEILIEQTIDHKSIDLVHKFKDRDGNPRVVAIEIELSTKGLANAQRNLAVQSLTYQWLIVGSEDASNVLAVLDREIPRELRNRIHVSILGDFLRDYVSWWRQSYE